jgi:hypothetical protein
MEGEPGEAKLRPGGVKTMTTSRFTGQVVPQSRKQLTYIVRVIARYFIFSDSGTSHKDPDSDKWSNVSNVQWLAQK